MPLFLQSVSPSVTVIHIGDEVNLPTVLQDRTSKKASSSSMASPGSTTTVVHHHNYGGQKSTTLSGTRPDVVEVVSSAGTPTPTLTGNL